MKKTDPRIGDTRITESSGNVFIDLGFDEAEAKAMAMQVELLIFRSKTMPKSTVVAKRAVKKSAPTKTMPYDVAAQLRTPEEMAAYLDAWLAEAPDDAAGIARALGDIARAKGMTQVAKEASLSRESIFAL